MCLSKSKAVATPRCAHSIALVALSGSWVDGFVAGSVSVPVLQKQGHSGIVRQHPQDSQPDNRSQEPISLVLRRPERSDLRRTDIGKLARVQPDSAQKADSA